MLAFIDESGDAGMKLDGSSTPFLTVVVVVFNDLNTAHVADAMIEDKKKSLGMGRGWEFKFNKASKSRRLDFLDMVRDLDFEIFGVVVNKAKLLGPISELTVPIYELACSRACENAREALKNATVVIDGSGSRDFRRSFTSQLRKHLRLATGESQFKKLKFENSEKNNLLQLADMVCGAIARSYSGKSDATEYRSILIAKETSVEFWPKG